MADVWRDGEWLLGTDPEFGDSSAIEARSLARLRVGMKALAAVAPDRAAGSSMVAAVPDADLLTMMRDPVLRNAFEADLQTMAGLQSTVGSESGMLLLPQFLPLAQDGSGYAISRSADQSAPFAWPALDRAWMLTEIPATMDEPVADRLRILLRRQFPDGTAQAPIPPTAKQLRTITEAAELLNAVLPTVGPAVLRHIGMVGLAKEESLDGPLHSISGGDPFPATVFLSPEKLDNVWDAAGALLHEGLHLTLFDVLLWSRRVRQCRHRSRHRADPLAGGGLVPDAKRHSHCTSMFISPCFTRPPGRPARTSSAGSARRRRTPQ